MTTLSTSFEAIIKSLTVPTNFIAVLGFGLIGVSALSGIDLMPRQIMMAVGILLIIVCVVMISFAFLKSPSLLQSERVAISSYDGELALRQAQELKELSNRIISIENKLSFQGPQGVDLIDTIDRKIAHQIQNHIADDVIELATVRLEENLSRSRSLDHAREAFETSIYRLKREVDRLVKSSAYNLAIGGTISLSGISALTYFLVFEQSTQASTLDFVVHYAPRLGLVILIEAFSFFFLNLYRSSQAEIKYTQNELTNIEQKFAAFEVSRLVDGDEEITSVVKSLLDTERNFVIKKGETTIEIEKVRLESKHSTESIVRDISRFVGYKLK